MRILTRLILISIILLSCSTNDSDTLPEHIEEKELDKVTVYSPDEEPTHNIAMEKEVTYGDAENDQVFIGRLNDISVDSAGRVYASDAQERDIKVYEPEGSFVTRLGRQGQGPGEFSGIHNIAIAENQLFAPDLNEQKVNVFSVTSHDFEYAVNLADNRGDYTDLDKAFPGAVYFRSDGTFLIEFEASELTERPEPWDISESVSLYFRLDEDGRINSEKLFEQPSETQIFVPIGGMPVGHEMHFMGENHTALSNDDRIFTAWSRDVLIKVYDPNGDYMRAIYYPYEGIPMTRESILEEGYDEELWENLPPEELPETWPVLQEMFVDDENRIWAAVRVEDTEMHQWTVMDEYGELKARFTWPRDRDIRKIRDNKIYTLETEEETGLQQVVRYSIDMQSAE